jgi:hypothetical protein
MPIIAGKTMKLENGEDCAFILGASDLLIPLRGQVKTSTFGESTGLLARNLISTSSASLCDDDDDDDVDIFKRFKELMNSSNSSSDSSSINISSILDQNVFNIGQIFEVPSWRKGVSS